MKTTKPFGNALLRQPDKFGLMLETMSMQIANMEKELHRVHESVIDSHVRDLRAAATKNGLQIDPEEIDPILRKLMDEGYLPHEVTNDDIIKKLKELT